MSENLKPPMPEDASSAVVSEQSLNSGLSSDALARRRMLLKSVGKGATVMTAASVPMHSLASIRTITNIGKNGAPKVGCGISGMMSGVHSQEPSTTATCSGYSPGRYKKIENWPQSCNTDYGSFNKDTKFLSLFGGGLDKGLLAIMNENSSSDEFHWITALLNGCGGVPTTFNFPYTGTDVIKFYKGQGVYTAAKALEFFKTYMEIHP
jgi:hypothetical protein